MQAMRKLICFCVAVASRLEQGCACFTGISVCRKMINGASGTKAPQIERLQASQTLSANAGNFILQFSRLGLAES